MLLVRAKCLHADFQRILAFAYTRGFKFGNTSIPLLSHFWCFWCTLRCCRCARQLHQMTRVYEDYAFAPCCATLKVSFGATCTCSPTPTPAPHTHSALPHPTYSSLHPSRRTSAYTPKVRPFIVCFFHVRPRSLVPSHILICKRGFTCTAGNTTTFASVFSPANLVIAGSISLGIMVFFVTCLCHFRRHRMLCFKRAMLNARHRNGAKFIILFNIFKFTSEQLVQSATAVILFVHHCTLVKHMCIVRRQQLHAHVIVVLYLVIYRTLEKHTVLCLVSKNRCV